MGKLVDIYTSIKNQNLLEDEELLKKIVLKYSKSGRTTLLGNDVYDSLVKLNQTKDTSGINLDDKEKFFVKTYNQWIENMINLDEAHIQYLEANYGMDARKIQQYFKSFGKVSSMDDINKLKRTPLFDKEINNWRSENNGWEHIKSKYISGKTENRIEVKHRLYIGCQNQDMWRLAQLFKSKCEEQQIPFYFKLGVSKERDDKMVIYADTDNLANYINILQEIAQENPEIMRRCGKPPALTGKIDGWIGIGDEPPKKNGKNQSYNSLRAEIFEDSIEEVLLSSIADFKGKDVIYKVKQIKFNELFLKQATQTIIDRLDRNKDSKLNLLSKYGVREEDLSDVKFKKYIKSHLRGEIQKGLNKLIDVKDIKSQLLGNNGIAIFTIPTRKNKNIEVTTYDMDAIIKAMVPIMQEIDPNFMDKIKSKVQEKYRQNSIDDTFVFQNGSKEKFEQADLAQLKQQGNNNLKQKTSERENHKAEKQETDETKDETTINNVDIVKMINPDILKQKIKLPNGAEIPVKQYIQEVVAPHIPSNGKFILKSNGGEIPAKQFIEEVVMSVGQEKYNGDINALLEDMTISDIGAISTAQRKKTPIGQEHVMSQETSEIRKHKSFAERAKKNSEPLDNKQRKAGRSMTDRMTTMINVKRSISQSRITKSETQQQTEEMTNNVKVRKLLQKQNSGAFLTEEEKRFIEQHIKETTEAQIRFMNQQNKKKNRGIEM